MKKIKKQKKRHVCTKEIHNGSHSILKFLELKSKLNKYLTICGCLQREREREIDREGVKNKECEREN